MTQLFGLIICHRRKPVKEGTPWVCSCVVWEGRGESFPKLKMFLMMMLMLLMMMMLVLVVVMAVMVMSTIMFNMVK